jgi:hypothetical protein
MNPPPFAHPIAEAEAIDAKVFAWNMALRKADMRRRAWLVKQISEAMKVSAKLRTMERKQV